MLVNPRTLLSPNRLDVLAPYLYAKHRELGVQGGWARRLYANHMLHFNGCREPDGSGKAGLQAFLDSFHAVLDSVKRDGYRDDAPAIPIGHNGIMVDGAHRLAACLLYGKDVRTEASDRPEFAYDYGYLERHGLARPYLDAMLTAYCELASDVRVATTFPQAHVLTNTFSGVQVNWRQVEVTEQGARNLMAIMYPGAPWGDRKARLCFPDGGGMMGVGILRGATDIIAELKADVRLASGVGNHSIHITDTHEEAVWLVHALLNANSVDWLNQGPFLGPFCGEEHRCLDGSAVMALYGLREARDLDYLSWPSEPDAHNAETERYHAYHPSDIVYNPERHFWKGDFKCATLEVVRHMKERRRETKDLTDLELLGKRPDKPVLVNVVYAHLQAPYAEHRGNCSVAWTATPVEGADLYAYADAFSYRGPTGGLDVLLMLEPHTVLPGQYSEEAYARFDHVYSWCDSVWQRGGKFQRLYLPAYGQPDATGALRQVPDYTPGGERRDAIVMIHGNKQSSQPGEMYSERRRFAEWFAANTTTQMEVYGRPGFDSLPNYRGVCGDKHETMSRYRFCLAMDNTCNPVWSAGYFTREVLDALYAGCIPIVKGCWNIEDYLPDECYIDLRQWANWSNGYAALDAYLQAITPEQEAAYHQAIARYLASPEVERYHAHSTYMQLFALCGSEPTGDWAPGLADGRDKLAARTDGAPVWSWTQLAETPPVASPRKRVLHLAPVKELGGPLPAEFLRALAGEFGCHTYFVETGTGSGQTAATASGVFERVFTVDLSRALASKATSMLASYDNVKVTEGHSAQFLRSLRLSAADEAMLWLDAHWSGTGYARGPENVPLLAELAAIASWPVKPPCILMDDMRYCAPATVPVFPGGPTSGFPSLIEIQAAVKAISPAYRFVLYGDIGMAYLPHDGFEVGADVVAYQAERLKAPSLTSILILNYNGKGRIETCLDSIRRYTPEPHDIIVIENASTDGSREWLRTVPGITLIENTTNLGCPPARAQGMPLCKGDYVVLLDNDTIVTPGWLAACQMHARAHPELGIIGPRSNYVSGPQIIPNVPYRDMAGLLAFAAQRQQENAGKATAVQRLVGFCMFVRRALIDKIGVVDGSFGKFGFEDDDYCRRAIQAGFICAMAEDVFVHHTGGPQTRGDAELNGALLEAKAVFERKWAPTAERVPVGVLVFSKDRALQLELCIHSLVHHWSDTAPIVVLYAASNARHEAQYRTLASEYSGVTFQRQGDFRPDIEAILAQWQHVCFVVDDTIFTHAFSLERAAAAIGKRGALGFSLRLGKNVTHGGPPESEPFRLPSCHGGPNILSWRWSEAGEDRGFGYPLEISSSVYPTATIRAMTARYRYDSPNQLEAVLHECRKGHEHEPMLCYSHSVAFSAVWNTTQQGKAYSCGMTAEQMADAFDAGKRLDWKAYAGYETCAYHTLPPVHWRKELPNAC